MRVLLDGSVDRRLKRVFDEQHEVSTVPERGLAGMKNGDLLEVAANEFDAFVTTDRGIPYQQNLSRFDLAVIILEAKTTSYEDLASLMETVPTPLLGTWSQEKPLTFVPELVLSKALSIASL